MKNTLLTDPEIVGDAFILGMAGHETTAVTLNYTLAMPVLHGPQQTWLYKKLQPVLGNQSSNPRGWLYSIFADLERPLAAVMVRSICLLSSKIGFAAPPELRISVDGSHSLENCVCSHRSNNPKMDWKVSSRAYLQQSNTYSPNQHMCYQPRCNLLQPKILGYQPRRLRSIPGTIGPEKSGLHHGPQLHVEQSKSYSASYKRERRRERRSLTSKRGRWWRHRMG